METVEEIKLPRIKTVNIERSVFKNKGTITISSDTSEITFSDIENCDEIYNICKESMERFSPSIKNYSLDDKIHHERKKRNWKRFFFILSLILIIIAVGVLAFFLGKSTNNNTTRTTEIITDSVVANQDVDTIPDQEIGKNNSSPAEKLQNMLETCSWKKMSGGFKIPDFFTKDETFMTEDYLYWVDEYSFDNVIIGYCPTMGSWAVCDFPVKGSELSRNATIKDITYDSDPIFSGYTTDGRIYYMKKIVHIDGCDEDGEGGVYHPSFLVTIYPKEYKKNVDKIVYMILNW